MTTSNWFLNNPQEEEIWAYQPTLTKEQCDNLIRQASLLQLQDAVVGSKSLNDSTIRKSRVSWIPSDNPEYHWVFRACTDMVNSLNAKYFQYDLMYIESLQFTEYDGNNPDPAFYGQHIDSAVKNNGSRKLSFSVLLSDENSFDGGDLMLYYQKDGVPATKKQGVAVAFTSNLLHEVTPVTKGIRYSLVGWVVGPRFK
jgi:PKHD-type hydroxylase